MDHCACRLPIFSGIGVGIAVAATTESIGLGFGLAASAIVTGLIMSAISYIAKPLFSNRIGYVPDGAGYVEHEAPDSGQVYRYAPDDCAVLYPPARTHEAPAPSVRRS